MPAAVSSPLGLAADGAVAEARVNQHRGIMIRLDPRSPLVIDARELGRRPGTMRRVRRTIAAPPGLGTVVIGVPEGSDLELDLRLEAVMEGVLVSGTVSGRVGGECVRCLDPVTDVVEADVQELYVYPGRTPAGEEEDELRELEDDMIDFEPALYDTLVPALPFRPLCRDDCPGLCSECGARLADEPGHVHGGADPRWAELARLRGPLTEHDEHGVPTLPDTEEK
jgi:uncharacterized protein